MARTHHYEFVYNALRRAFFDDPDRMFAALTARRERPLLALWNDMGELVAALGEPRLKPIGLKTMLVNLGHEHACVLVMLPQPTEGFEAYYVALVAGPNASEFVTLQKPLAAEVDPSDAGYGELWEWTADGSALDVRVEVAVTVSEFVSAVRDYVTTHKPAGVR